jgi:hypothetical protein
LIPAVRHCSPQAVKFLPYGGSISSKWKEKQGFYFTTKALRHKDVREKAEVRREKTGRECPISNTQY